MAHQHPICVGDILCRVTQNLFYIVYTCGVYGSIKRVRYFNPYTPTYNAYIPHLFIGERLRTCAQNFFCLYESVLHQCNFICMCIPGM